MKYQPIENYGIIGDLNTVALVGLHGSIDFMCFPNFDSPSIFAALLDQEKGGRFSIQPTVDGVKYKQLYLPDTNVLLTRFLSDGGIAEITDFMPVEELYQGKELIRRVTCVHGNMTFSMYCGPRFNYASCLHEASQQQANEITFSSTGPDGMAIRIKRTVPLQEEAGVNRSALVLKLLTSHQYGSIVAAPTFGLPEEIGGVRNWDYRYTWIRDASFTVYTLLRLGYTQEAKGFVDWVDRQCDDVGSAGYLRLMYTLEGAKDLKESTLEHLEG